ncbi:19252_t:CDS:1, partial [Racocetra persica]
LFHGDLSKFTCYHKEHQSQKDQIWTNLHITTLDYADILDTTPTDSDHYISLLEVTLSATPISLYKQP